MSARRDHERSIIIAIVLLLGCGGGDPSGSDTTTSVSATTSATMESSDGSGTAVTETPDGTSTSSTSDPDSTGTSTDTTAPEPTGSSTGTSTTGGGKPNGDFCEADAECMSQQCDAGPLGGVCGECNEDADCPAGGCTRVTPENGWSKCNQGELGGGCETSEVCMAGLTCGVVVDIPGVALIRSCGECLADGECGPDEVCAPLYSFAGGPSSGARECIGAGTLPQDAYCDLAGTGDAACTSGHCGPVDPFGQGEIGLCGECETDQDCGGGTCTPGAAFSGSTCT